jgi:hypothetical protein
MQDFVSEIFGLSPTWVIQRNCAILLLKLRPTEINVTNYHHTVNLVLAFNISMARRRAS